jgi:NTP pyrophosphatase (non-canonical NTP hydrolase)
MDFAEYQRRAQDTDQNPAPSEPGESDPRTPQREYVIPLLGLVGEVGSLLGEYKKLLRDGGSHRRFQEEVAEELGDILWYLANVATKFSLDLGEIAARNLSKTEDRWRSSERPRELFDAKAPTNQQLPRHFKYRFQHQEHGAVEKLVLVDLLSGETSGDPLTDNAYEDDGYRYHDAIHLSMAALLGWSPVWRKLLRNKKLLVHREPSSLDSAEDGGRAQVIEEAIVAAAYVYASDHEFLQGTSTVDWHLLRHIKQLTKSLEVKDATTWEWNEVVLKAFEIFRKLRANRGGVVTGDLADRTISFSTE